MQVIAKDALGRRLNVGADPVDPLLRQLLNLLRQGRHPFLDQLATDLVGVLQIIGRFILQRVVDLAQLIRQRVAGFLAALNLAVSFQELFGEQRLGSFRFLADAPDVLQNVGQPLVLLGQAVLQRLFHRRVAQGFLGVVVHGFKLALKFVLLPGELAGVVAQLAHLLRELAGDALTEIIAHLLQILLGPRAGRERRRSLLLAELLGGVAHVLTRLLQFLPGFCHAGFILLVRHPLVQFIQLAEQLLLLFLQALQLPAQLLFCFPVFRSQQFGLQFLHPLVQVVLAAREILETAQHLQVFALFGRLLRLGLTFVLVAVLLFREVQFVELLLIALAAPAAAFAAAHLELTRLQTQQLLIGLLFRRQSPGQWLEGNVARSARQLGAGFLHRFGGLLQIQLHPRITEVGAYFPGLGQRFVLRLVDDFDVVLVTAARLLGGLGPLHIPGGRDDVLLQLEQFR